MEARVVAVWKERLDSSCPVMWWLMNMMQYLDMYKLVTLISGAK
jgi:hypothetical protein